jgi:hypothetical protein
MVQSCFSFWRHRTGSYLVEQALLDDFADDFRAQFAAPPLMAPARLYL